MPRKTIRFLLLGLLILFAVGSILDWVGAKFDARFNPTGEPSPYAVGTEARSLHEGLTVVVVISLNCPMGMTFCRK